MKPSTFRLGIFQCDLIWENTEANLEQLEATLKNQSVAFCDLLVLPEMYSTGFSMNPKGKAINEIPGALERLSKMAMNQKIRIAASFNYKVGENYRNRFLLIDSNGIQAHYDKKHLFGLGKETETFEPGNEKSIWEINGWRIAPFVCYDLRFPEWCRNDQEADLMLFTANWPETRSHHWKTLLTARAIENQCYVAGVNRIGTDGNSLNYSGDSLVLDPLGNTMLSGNKKTGVFLISLSDTKQKEVRRKYPFLNDRLSTINKQIT